MPGGSELLNAVAAYIRHIDAAISVHQNVARLRKLSVAGTG